MAARSKGGNTGKRNRIKNAVIECLKGKHVCSLATMRRDGYPQANVVDCVNEGLNFYIATYAGASKVDNIMLSPKASLTVAGKSSDYCQD